VLEAHIWPWGSEVTVVDTKDIVIPDNLTRAMAEEAEIECEKRAKIIAAEGELVASEKLSEAAKVPSSAPVSIQLRTLQTLAEISSLRRYWRNSISGFSIDTTSRVAAL
jgi:regulator of protease activity HflC (stomatin/prohibitin superfamily)